MGFFLLLPIERLKKGIGESMEVDENSSETV